MRGRVPRAILAGALVEPGMLYAESLNEMDLRLTWPAAREAAGFHVSVMPWFKQRDVALISSDAVQDVQPSNIEGFPRPIHMLSINTLGMPMIDVADLEEVSALAAKLKRWEFMLTVTALPAPGGSGSPVNPVATF